MGKVKRRLRNGWIVAVVFILAFGLMIPAAYADEPDAKEGSVEQSVEQADPVRESDGKAAHEEENEGEDRHESEGEDENESEDENKKEDENENEGEDGREDENGSEDEGGDEEDGVEDEDSKDGKQEKGNKKEKGNSKAHSGQKRGLERALERVAGTPAEPVIQALLEGQNPSEVLKALKAQLKDNDEDGEETDGEASEEEVREEELEALKEILEELEEKLDELMESLDESSQEASATLSDYEDLAELYEEIESYDKALEVQEKLFAKTKGDEKYYEKLKALVKGKKDRPSLLTYINGQRPVFDVEPYIEGGRTLVPVRTYAETLGAEVAWDGETQTVTISKGDTVIQLTIGKRVATVNGQEVALDAAATIKEGRTFIPLRFVGESLNSEVTYDGEAGVILVTEKAQDTEK